MNPQPPLQCSLSLILITENHRKKQTCAVSLVVDGLGSVFSMCFYYPLFTYKVAGANYFIFAFMLINSTINWPGRKFVIITD